MNISTHLRPGFTTLLVPTCKTSAKKKLQPGNVYVITSQLSLYIRDVLANLSTVFTTETFSG